MAPTTEAAPSRFRSRQISKKMVKYFAIPEAALSLFAYDKQQLTKFFSAVVSGFSRTFSTKSDQVGDDLSQVGGREVEDFSETSSNSDAVTPFSYPLPSLLPRSP